MNIIVYSGSLYLSVWHFYQFILQQPECIDDVKFCFIQSLAVYRFLLQCRYVKHWKFSLDIKSCNVFEVFWCRFFSITISCFSFFFFSFLNNLILTEYTSPTFLPVLMLYLSILVYIYWRYITRYNRNEVNYDGVNDHMF